MTNCLTAIAKVSRAVCLTPLLSSLPPRSCFLRQAFTPPPDFVIFVFLPFKMYLQVPVSLHYMIKMSYYFILGMQTILFLHSQVETMSKIQITHMVNFPVHRPRSSSSSSSFFLSWDSVSEAKALALSLSCIPKVPEHRPMRLFMSCVGANSSSHNWFTFDDASFPAIELRFNLNSNLTVYEGTVVYVVKKQVVFMKWQAVEFEVFRGLGIQVLAISLLSTAIENLVHFQPSYHTFLSLSLEVGGIQ